MKTYKLKDVTVTEEEIKRLAIEAGIVEPEKVDKAYSSGELRYLKVFTGETKSFGFDLCANRWEKIEYSTPLSHNFWKPATDTDKQRWKELLLEKAESMGYENGNYKCLSNPKLTATDRTHFIYQNGFVLHSNGFTTNMVFNGDTGEWAKIIIPELTHEQIEGLFYADGKPVGKFKYKPQ